MTLRRIVISCATLAAGVALGGEAIVAARADGVPRAVTVARATAIPACTLFVDAAAPARGAGTAQSPHRTIGEAVARAQPGSVICVAEGRYPESLQPGAKHLTLAGGFRRGTQFAVRDSAAHVSRAVGSGSGSFVDVGDPAPQGQSRTVIDGFDISGYSQAIRREHWESQRLDITNNHIHDNRCTGTELAGAGFALNNVSGRIQGNVIRNNACGRGGAGFVNDDARRNEVVIEGNLIEGNAGTEPGASHGGGLYLFTTRLRVTANTFVANRVTQWGAGLYIGANTGGGQTTTASLNWNVYRGNRAGNSGGGLFCDDGARCVSYHEIFDGNCGGNILLDSGPEGAGPTTARFEHLTNINARDVTCARPGFGVQISKDNTAPGERYAFVNALFWGNAPGGDIAAFCDKGCELARVEVAYSMVQTGVPTGAGMRVRFGEAILAPADPLLADPARGDYHLRAAAGRWTPSGRVRDTVTSPAVAAGTPIEAGPRRGQRIELGAYGNSAEASGAQ